MNRLVVMMGYPGSGKSTYAKNFKDDLNNCIYLSSDLIREELFGFRDQTRNDEVFKTLHQRIREYAHQGDCIYDATSLTRKTRINIVNKFKNLYELELIFVVRPIWEIIEANNTRTEVERLPQDQLIKMLTRFDLPTYDEGWDHINIYLNTDNKECFDIDRLEDINHDNPYHNETIKEHIKLVNSLAQATNNKLLINIAKYHDLGKFYTKVFKESKGYSQYIGHEIVSSYIYLTDKLIQDRNKLSYYDYEGLINNYDFIYEFFGILYHDLFYRQSSIEELVEILSRPKRPIYYLFDELCVGNDFCPEIYIKDLANTLKEFNILDTRR